MSARFGRHEGTTRGASAAGSGQLIRSADDQAVCCEVESLLSYSQQAENFIETPALAVGSIGPYRLIPLRLHPTKHAGAEGETDDADANENTTG